MAKNQQQWIQYFLKEIVQNKRQISTPMTFARSKVFDQNQSIKEKKQLDPMPIFS